MKQKLKQIKTKNVRIRDNETKMKQTKTKNGIKREPNRQSNRQNRKCK